MKTREWLAITLVFGFLIMNFTITWCARYEAQQALLETPLKKNLNIELVGAIEKPGIYQCPFGSSLGELLKKVKLQPKANPKKIPFKKILLTDQRIEIPQKKEKVSSGKKISLEEK